MRALTMDEAADALRIGRRSFQEIVKRYPFYYPNGRRKLFTPNDIEAIRIHAGLAHEETPLDVLRNFIAKKLPPEEIASFMAFVGRDVAGTVYLIRCNDRVKIGFTGHWGNRLRVLRTACPYPVDVIATIAGDRHLEQYLHAGFADYRRHGEWFNESGDLADVVKRIEGLE